MIAVVVYLFVVVRLFKTYTVLALMILFSFSVQRSSFWYTLEVRALLLSFLLDDLCC